MATVIDDVRQACRTLLKAPGFTIVSLGMLGVAIGANTAIFTVLDAVLLRPLPFPDAGQLVRITADFTGRRAADVGVSVPELFDYEQQHDLFTAVSGEYPVNANVTGADEPERLETQIVSPSYFTMLGVPARLGRVFGPQDYTPGITEVAIISDGFWKRRFGAAPDVLGRTLRIDNDLFTIVGVMPPGFRHPGLSIQGDVEVWVPSGYRATPFNTPRRGALTLQGAIARLRPGVPMATARARLEALGAAALRDFPDAYPRDLGWQPRIVPLRDSLSASVRPALWLLLGAVGLVLLIACANVANLLLARAAVRRREFAIRQALGAGPGRVLRQVLIESLVLSGGAGLLGLLIASWSLQALIALAPADAPLMADASVDGRVLLFSIGVSALTGLAFGLVPARQAARADPQEALRDTAGRGQTGGATTQRWRQALVVGEFGLALVLLVYAALLVRSFARLYAVDPGFDTTNLLTARLWMPQPNDPTTGPYFAHARRVRLYEEMLDRLTARPDVEAAGWISRLPQIGPMRASPMTIDGRPLATAEVPAMEFYLASEGYFQTMRIPLLRGRLFTSHDDERAPQVVLINERFAQRYFAGEDPIGRRVRPGRAANHDFPWLTIVGVVQDVRASGLDREPIPQVYRPLRQASGLQMALVVRGRAPGSAAGGASASGPAGAVARAARWLGLGGAVGDGAGNAADHAVLRAALPRELRALDGELPLFAVRSMAEVMARATSSRRFAMVLLGLFAATALLLAAMGIYATMAFLVRQRTHEIGIRLALGARPMDAIALVFRRGLVLTAAGAGIGLAAAIVAARLLRGLLFGVSTADPISFLARRCCSRSSLSPPATSRPAARRTSTPSGRSAPTDSPAPPTSRGGAVTPALRLARATSDSDAPPLVVRRGAVGLPFVQQRPSGRTMPPAFHAGCSEP